MLLFKKGKCLINMNNIFSCIRCGKKAEIFQVDGDYWLSFAGKITKHMTSSGTISGSLTSKKLSNRNPPFFFGTRILIIWHGWP